MSGAAGLRLDGLRQAQADRPGEAVMKMMVMGMIVAAVAILLLSGCKKVHMVPTSQGWMEMETSKDENVIKLKPAEKVKVKYE